MKLLRFRTFLLEASTGVDKWEKYFSGKDVETKIKTKTALLTPEGTKTSEYIQPGEVVVVKQSDKYQTLPLILYQSKEYRVSFSAIDKPIARKVSFQLKPDKFGLVGEFSYASYMNTAIEAVQNSNVPDNIKEYLANLVRKAYNKISDDKLILSFVHAEADQGLINTINNDFMEVIGPVLAIQKQGYSNKSIIYFPSKGNEALLDFKIIDKGVNYIYSSKTAATKQTNTIKSNDILKGLDGVDTSKYSKQIEILKIVSESPTTKLPIILAKYLGIDNDIDDTNVVEILQLEKKCLIEINKLEWLPIVKLSIPKLLYIKLGISNKGIPSEAKITSGENLEKAYWRSKNSPGHFKDKIGLQI